MTKLTINKLADVLIPVCYHENSEKTILSSGNINENSQVLPTPDYSKQFQYLTSMIAETQQDFNIPETPTCTSSRHSTAKSKVPFGLQNNIRVLITVDAEWDSHQKQWLSTQVYVKSPEANYLYFFCWEGVSVNAKSSMNNWAKNNGVNFVESPNPDNFLTYLMDTLHLWGQAHLRFYYSLKDVEYLIGKDLAKDVFLNKLKKIRAVMGEFKVKSSNYSLTVNCRDAVGWSNIGGLEELTKAVGVEMENKSSMDKYKSNMLRGAEEVPIDFIKYALDDVMKLDEVFDKYTELINWVEIEVLHIPKHKAFTVNTIPMTLGSIVAKSFEKWIINRSNKPDMLNFAIRKLGEIKLKQGTNKLNKDLEAFKWANQSWTIESLELESNNSLFKYFLDECKFEQLAYSGASIPELAKHPWKNSTACYNAVVQGGRCNNEIPTEYKIDNALDIDLQSAYGSTLRSLIYPVGIPRGWSYSPNEEKPKLGKFLKDNEKSLISGLWQIVVEGELPFRQDLVFSKDVKGSDINKAAHSEFSNKQGDIEREDKSHIPSTFCLLRKEIVNGIITADILEVIRKVSSNKELKEWMNLNVVCAKAWLIEDKCDSEEDFINKVLANSSISKGRKRKVDLNQSVEDNRPAYWYEVHLEEFIGKLVDTRIEFKKIGKEGDSKASAKQQVIKLFINTLYGVFASPFFSIGNAVIANNITARARVGAWLTAKALKLRQTITDGGLYTPTGVAFYKGKKPSFTTLNNMSNWEDYSEKRKVLPLGGIDWEVKFKEFKLLEEKEIQLYIDNLASQHIEEFWQPYSLSLERLFKIEHKVEHTATRAAYLCKGHYALKFLKLKEGISPYRVRGSKKYSQEELRNNCIFELLDAILEGRDIPDIVTFEYDYRHLLSLSDWQQAQQTNGYENYKSLMPGDNVIDIRIFRLNNNYFPVDTLREYLSRQDRKKVIRGESAQWYERHLSEGIPKTVLRMEKDNL